MTKKITTIIELAEKSDEFIDNYLKGFLIAYEKTLLSNKCKNIKKLINKKKKKILNTIFLIRYCKEKGGCSECPENDYTVLHFDHIDRDEKSNNISFLLMKDYGIDAIKNELSKCRILCSNCHHKHTAKQLNYYNLDLN